MKEYIEQIFSQAKWMGLDDVEIYLVKTKAMSINVYEGQVESTLLQEEESLSLRGIYEGRMGYSYTEKLVDESIPELLANLIHYAQCNESPDLEELSQGLELVDEKKEDLLSQTSVEEKISYLLDLEKKAYETDKRVKKISQCSYEEKTKEIHIKNTLGLDLKEGYTTAILSLGTVAEEEQTMQTGYSFLVVNALKEKDQERLIKESVGDALALLGSESIPTGTYEVLLRSNVAAELMSAFMPIFFSDQVQMGLSLLKGKEGTMIAHEKISLLEDPQMNGGVVRRSFDDEGSLCRKKYLIESGRLKTFLYNKKTGKREGKESTGNGFRDSHKSSLGVGSTNLYLKPGKTSLEALLSQMEEGILITDVDGLHAGVSPTSGNFSLISKGFLVKNKKIERPVSQITIAGNFFDLLKELKGIGNDLAFSYPTGNLFGSPSLYLGKLEIGGE